jgi:putative endonuclease
VTTNLLKRVWEHKANLVDGFTKRYGIHRLVWFELHERLETALAREKALKAWQRAWKVALIERTNPTWHDLYPELL